jgi:gliding motility-associated-like protein
MNNRYLIILSVLLFFAGFVSAQTQTVNHHVDFNSGAQNMWGPSFSAFTLDQEITIFEVNWNESGGTGNGGIVTILGQQFGGAINGSTSGTIGAKFTLEGFTTGEVEVEYPVNIALTMPADNTYNTGTTVSINTAYTVESDYKLETRFPSLGEARLDLYFQMFFHVSATLCAFSCTSFNIIPPLSIPYTNFNIFTINQNGIKYFGPGCPWDPMSGLSFTPPYSPCDGCPVQCIPGQVEVDFFPLELPENDYGFSGSFTIPHVVTEYTLDGTDLVAVGDSTYVELKLEIFKFLGAFLPPPVGPILQNLSNEFTLPDPFGSIYGATASYTIFSASFGAYNTTHQNFRFSPTLYGRFELPTPVEFSVYNASNVLQSSGFGNIINFQVGHRIDFKFPCHYEFMDVVPTYSIDPQFSNHTYDQISFDFSMAALQFGINLPAITIVPQICVPAICIPYAYPCPTWSRPWRWCTGSACTPAFCTPAVGFPGWGFNIGPLWSHTIPLGALPNITYFNETWTLEGFSETTITGGFRMRARPFESTITHNDILCFGDVTGSVDLTLVNGTAPFTYQWNNGAGTQDISDLGAGNYHVTVFDVNGCQTFNGATVIGPGSALALSAQVQDKSCFGGLNNGRIDLLAEGGTPGYSYLWNTGATTPVITDLDAGMYSVTVTDNNGCTALLSREINQPSQLQLAESTLVDVDCFGNSTGSIGVQMLGGTPPYAYNWSNGGTSPLNSGLPAGVHSLTVTDQKGCSITQGYTINQPDLLTITASALPVDCFGAATGSISTVVNGGNGGYSFVWTNPENLVMAGNTGSYSNLVTGNYGIIVKDTKNCIAQIDQFVSQPDAPLTSTHTKIEVNCHGDATGSIQLNPAGGTFPYFYAWSNGITTQDNLNLPAGNYSVDITDNNGCLKSYAYEIVQPDAPLSGSIEVRDVSCFGGNDGKLTATISGGTAPYTYSWSTGGASPIIGDLSAGGYSLEVIDAKNCVLLLNANVIEPLASLALSSNVVDVSCHGDQTGSIDLTVVGGTADYTYEWSNGASILLSNVQQDLMNIGADTYLVRVTDSKGCADSLHISVAQPAQPIALTAVTQAVNCFGGNDGEIDLSVGGGTPGYTYSWSNGALIEDLIGVSGGDYVVVVTDGNGCQKDITVTVAQPAAPLIGQVVTTPVLCNGELTGTVDLTVQGGTAPYTYNWNSGATTEDLNQVESDLYTVTVTDANGCLLVVGGFVGQPQLPLTIDIVMNEPSCFAYSDGSVVLNVTGGTTPYYFAWGDQNEFLLNNPSETLGGLFANDYFYRVRDKNGCEVQGYVTVTQPDTISMTGSIQPVTCYGGNDGSVTVVGFGGTQPYGYSWSNGATQAVNPELTSGMYDLTFSDANGCTYRESYFVPQPTEIQIASTVVPVTCIDQSDAQILIQTAGGTPPYQWSWSNGETTASISGLYPGGYDLLITDANNCQKSYEFTVAQNFDECLIIVNSFTPNGDVYNDTWVIKNIDLYPNAEVRVFNRWGNLVFESIGEYDPWDGSFKGEPLPSEVYYYIIELNNAEDNKYTGTVTIVR